jgi:crossover junction endodeoxyribonuclease RuvC
VFATGGIDPGLNGACAVYTPDAPPPLRLAVFDIPTVGLKKDRRVNAAALRDWLLANRPSRLAIERVNAMPSQHLTNGARVAMPPSYAFRFGDACGSIRTCVVCCDLQYRYVTPQVWKKYFGLSNDKEESRQKAIALFPASASLFVLKKHDGRAEAALIALWEAAQ